MDIHEVKKMSAKTEKKHKTIVIRVGLCVLCVVVIAVITVVLIRVININNNKARLDNVSINSEEAGNVDPTNYELDEKENLQNKFSELFGDGNQENINKIYEHFTGLIDGALRSGDSEYACKILWVEHDSFMERGMPAEALESLLRMNDAELANYQKIYLYRAIVTASVHSGNKAVEDEYTAKVQELDPPSRYEAAEGQSETTEQNAEPANPEE